MSESNKKKFLPSIRSKIWFSVAIVIALTVFCLAFSGYLISTLPSENLFIALTPFVLVLIGAGLLGWWLNKDISEALAKVAIGAQILERGGFNSQLPETGAKETEEILEKLQRYNQGQQRMAAAMEQVARGEMNISMRPSSTTDRFGAAFQKLLEETSAGIKVKTDLNDLQNSLKTLTSDVTAAKYGDLSVEAVSANEDIGQLAEVINHLVRNLRESVVKVRSNTGKSQSASQELQKDLQSILEFNDKVSEEINSASTTLKQLPKSAQRISEKLQDSATLTSKSLTQINKSVKVVKTNLSAATGLRGQIDDTSRRFQRMSEFSQEASKIVKVVEDLARRTNLIALNASIQANEAGDAGKGFGLVVKELEQLAGKASNATKEFSTLTRIIQSEANESRSAVEETAREAAGVTKNIVDTIGTLSELEKNISQLSEMQELLHFSAQKQSADSGEVAQIFIENAAGNQRSLGTIKEAVASTNHLIKLSKEMSADVSAFKLPFNIEETKRAYLAASTKEVSTEFVN